jgi:GNAT superfamily N-acetyltransferase
MIRSYEPADRAGVVALIVKTLAEFGFTADVGGLEEDLAAIEERYVASKRGGFWVAMESGRVVGTVAVRTKDVTTCELKRLYVSDQARGQGLGQKLYARTEDFARSAGYHRIWLDSSRRFTGARRLYERNGFVLLEELQNDWEDNCYEKLLTSPLASPL